MGAFKLFFFHCLNEELFYVQSSVDDSDPTFPTTFNFEMPYAEWKPFLPDSRTCKTMKPGWTEVFRSYFEKCNPYCTFAFKKHKVYVDNNKQTGKYFHAVGYCSHATCLTFTITSSSRPSRQNPVRFAVT